MKDTPPVYFWKSPLTVLSLALLVIVFITAVLVFYLPKSDIFNSEDREFSLYQPRLSLLDPSRQPVSTELQPLIDSQLFYIDNYFESADPDFLRKAISNVLVIDPANREALIFAARLARREKDTAACVDAARRLFRIYQDQAYLYWYARALKEDGKISQAYNLILMSRDKEEPCRELELLTACLALENDDPETAETSWRDAGAPPPEELSEYPLLREFAASHAASSAVPEPAREAL